MIHSLFAGPFLLLLPLFLGAAAFFGSLLTLEVLEIPVELESAFIFLYKVCERRLREQLADYEWTVGSRQSKGSDY